MSWDSYQVSALPGGMFGGHARQASAASDGDIRPVSRASLKRRQLGSVASCMQRNRTLRQMIADSMYVVDPERIAEAIVLRTRMTATVPELSFRNRDREIRVRSFRLSTDVPSFHLTGFPRRQPHRLNPWAQTRERTEVR